VVRCETILSFSTIFGKAVTILTQGIYCFNSAHQKEKWTT